MARARRARRFATRATGFASAHARVFARIVLALLVLAPGAARAQTPAPTSRPALPPDIVVISLDTLRADRLSLYGYGRRTDPQLRRLSQRAVLYTRATSTASWTLPAHASLFTGLYPTEHGSQMVRREPGASPKRALPLDPRFPTLAEVLEGAGYRTAGVAANFLYFKRIYHLDQGFQDWTVLPGKVGVSAAPASTVNDHAVAWLRARHAARVSGEERAPLFLFVNYMDAHTPYNTAPVEGLTGPTVEPFTLASHKQTQALVMGSDAPPPRARLRRLSDQYDQGVANADAGVGALLDVLRELGLYEDALVVVTADHGEFLGEHRLVGHGKDVYEGVLHVPLLVKGPGQTRGRKEDRRISLVHLPRMILADAGLASAIPADAFPHAWPARASIFAQNRYSLWVDLKRPWGKRFDRIRQALYDDDAKFIHSSDGDHALFDLARDPGETRNLLDPQRLAQWLARMETERPSADESHGEAVEAEAAPLSQEEEEQLRALGYID